MAAPQISIGDWRMLPGKNITEENGEPIASGREYFRRALQTALAQMERETAGGLAALHSAYLADGPYVVAGAL